MDDSDHDFKVLEQQVVSNHEKAKASHGHLELTHTRSGAYDVKPSRPCVSLNDLSPIHCRSMAVNTVHTGRVLRGTLFANPTVINAAHTILEDEARGVVNVSFYNFAPHHMDMHLNRIQLQRIADSLFPNGKKVAIFEPFYKRAQDGSLIVRVDNFHEDVIFPDLLGPQCSEGWREEGKTHFTNHQFEEAIFSYKRSIGTHDKSRLAAILLSNVATCLLQKELYGPSLLHAVTSFVVDSSMFRPFYTAGFSLNCLKRQKLAFNCLEQCRRLNAPPKICKQLEEGLRKTRKRHVPASKWNADILRLVAEEQVHSLLAVNSHVTVDSMVCKETGNKLFKEEQYDEAIREYCMALRGISEVAALLTNRGICYTKTGEHAEAALHASAAILIDPNNVKAHYWKPFSLLQLNHIEEARKSCDTALKMVGGNADLIALCERIKCACMVSSVEEENEKIRKGSIRLEQPKVNERQHEEALREHSAPAAGVAMMNKLLELLGISGDQDSSMQRELGMRLDDRVAPFHLEFSTEAEWPLQCDTHSGMELLTTAYEYARAPDRLREIDLDNLSQFDMSLLVKRLHSNDEAVIKWWFKEPLESLSPRKRGSYASNLHHSFTNSPSRENVLLFGTVHVSVGFVDLSGLLLSQLKTSPGHSGPLRWIGYEASAYSAAKSMVIAHMMKHRADTDCILQVWFSSSWSKKTLGSFRKALNELLNGTKGVNATTYSAEVILLWHHWQQFDVTLRSARSKWLSRHNVSSHSEIGNFRRKMDRLALCRYVVSGELLKGDVGSVVMFGIPSKKGEVEYEISLDEWFLHCLPIHVIVTKVDAKTSFIDATIGILRERISELKELVTAGKVVIEIQHKAVRLFENCLLREIRELSAHSISWSNICDYCSNEEFHKMAQACSGNDTIHYLSSMNWSTEVKGAFLIDYELATQEDLMENAKEAIAIWYRLTGLISYLHAPPMTHIYNIGSYYLCQNMDDAWIENFFKPSLKDIEKQTVIEHDRFDVLARAQSSIRMVYTYNKAKQLNDYDV